ncbi:MAG TPA: hypothetical protein VN861_02895 [Candidatus Acidoferrales bacterium]|nr:hypothetical protein [Candidatus Acidoferrales bacterium]
MNRLRNQLRNDLSRHRTWWRVTAVAVSAIVIVGVVLVGDGRGQSKSQSAGASSNPPSASTGAVATPTTVVHEPAPEYTPTETETLRLENAQLKAQLAQSSYMSASQQLPQYGEFQRTVGVLRAECESVKLEHKWPSGVQCDLGSQPVRFCEQSKMVTGANGQAGCPAAAAAASTKSEVKK